MALATATVAIIGLALTAASTAVALYGTDTAAKQAEANANFAADQAAADARAAQGAAEVEAARIRKAGQKKKAEAIAAMAASGVDVSSSASAIKITEGIEKDSAEDAYLTLTGGTDAAARLRQGAEADRIAGSSARTAGRINQAGTLLSFGSTAANTNWKRAPGAA
jgi:hypothetical protein